MKKIRKLFSALAAAAMAATAMPVPPMPASADGYGLTARTPAEIRAFYASHPWDVSDKTTFEEQPSAAQPQVLGAVSDASQERALNCLNFYRFTAGLPADVTLDAGYSEMAQAASMVSYMNRSLNHAPSQPSGLSDELFELGKTGCGSSNLAAGYSTLPDAIVNAYMTDSDSYNIPMVGHRRWILNPGMQKTGFGQVSNYSALYALDRSRSGQFTGDYVAWPPENMPYQLYRKSNRYPFSLSLGSAFDEPSADSVSVTVHSAKNNTDYTMDKNTTNYFGVNNQGYGMNRCIIFWPGTWFDMDDRLTVTVNGLTKKGAPASLSYPVSFFDLYAEDSQSGTTASETTTTTTTSTTFLPELRTGEIMYSFSEPGREFKVTVTPRGKTLEKVSVRFYGVNGLITEKTLLNETLAGTDPFVETVMADYVTYKVNISVSYRGDAPRLRCECLDAGQYEVTVPNEQDQVYTMGKTFNYDRTGSAFRVKVVPSGGALSQIRLRFFDSIGGSQEVSVLNSTHSGTFEQTVTAPYETNKVTVTVSFRGDIPTITCGMTSAVSTSATTVSTTTTETTTTTTRAYAAQTVSMKFRFASEGTSFLVRVSKSGGTIESATLSYGGRPLVVESKPIDCPKAGINIKYEIDSGSPVNEITLEITYTGSLPEMQAYQVSANGQQIPAEMNLRGDTDCSGHINIADAVMLARYIAEDSGVNLTAAGKLNADTDVNGLIESADLALLLQYLAGHITTI